MFSLATADKLDMGFFSVSLPVISQRLLLGLYMQFRWLDGVCLVPGGFSLFGFVASRVGVCVHIFRISGVGCIFQD